MMSKASFKRVGGIAIVLWLSGCPESRGPNLDGLDPAIDAADRGKGKKARPGAGDGVAPPLAPDATAEPCTDDVDPNAEDGPLVEAHTLTLWPPNHKFHDIALGDCVTVRNDCGGPYRAEFLWASSDEPIDDKGDGHHSPDILLGDDCDFVSVRSERQGPKDGRVYKLGVRVFDAAGNATDAACTIVVDHDQRGVIAADSGEKYRVTFESSAGGPICDGEPDEPPPPPPPGDDEDPLPDAGTDGPG